MVPYRAENLTEDARSHLLLDLVSGFGFRGLGSGFRVSGLGLGFGDFGMGLDLRFRVSGFGFWVSGSPFSRTARRQRGLVYNNRGSSGPVQ
jgi:hypothetical protein